MIKNFTIECRIGYKSNINQHVILNSSTKQTRLSNYSHSYLLGGASSFAKYMYIFHSGETMSLDKSQ